MYSSLWCECRFIYCDTAHITADNALPLMDAAKKYLLSELVTKCAAVLEKHLSTETVCTVLQQSMVFGANELKRKSLRFICGKARTRRVLATDAFLRLSADALEEIVSLDSLALVGERELFESCLKWAKHQLRGSGDECPSDEDIRARLGGVLYKIRFPIMTDDAFAELTARSKVLTSDEKNDVYVYMATGEKLPSLRFMTEGRCLMEEVIDRYTTAGEDWNCSGEVDAVSFVTTVDVYLTGVGLYGGIRASTQTVTLSVIDARQRERVSTTTTEMTSDGSQLPVPVRLESAVRVCRHTKYTLTAVIQGLLTWSGTDAVCAHDLEESGGGMITFYKSTTVSGIEVTGSHIPQLYYCLRDPRTAHMSNC